MAHQSIDPDAKAAREPELRRGAHDIGIRVDGIGVERISYTCREYRSDGHTALYSEPELLRAGGNSREQQQDCRNRSHNSKTRWRRKNLHPGASARRVSCSGLLDNPAVAHVNGLVGEGGGFRVVRDHEDGLAEALIEIAQYFQNSL